ncbi:NAD(P)-dependent oxidoreductase [Tepidibacillus marianensis]|uniref:NAD(P)-dependent oxidoreductase n=1 Tax=Tepidibacillus marianensis TaxID=3131995 RepID=UPI0030D2B790
MKVGFIGLGTMGFPMTKNLIKAGFEVWVNSRSRGPIDKAVGLGAKEAKTAKELAENADFILTALPMPDDIKKVYFGDEGILAGAKPGTILIDHSTVSPQLNLQIRENAKEQGVHFLDAPISGGPMGAEAGTLTIMVGGDKEVYEKAYSVFKAMGKTILYMGKTGNGSVAKLINNMLVGIHTAALSEAFVLGAKAGIGMEALNDVIQSSTGRSYMIDRCYPPIKERDFQQRFMIDLLYKDMGLVTEMGDQISVPLQLAKVAEGMIGEAKEAGYGHEDVAATIKPLEKKAHIIVK